jgi:hypothetical protein
MIIKNRDCALDDTCVLCSKCFHATNHENHETSLTIATSSSGCWYAFSSVSPPLLRKKNALFLNSFSFLFLLFSFLLPLLSFLFANAHLIKRLRRCRSLESQTRLSLPQSRLERINDPKYSTLILHQHTH